MFATNDALASGGMTNCWLRCGLTMFFLRPTDCVVAGARDDATLHDLVFEQHQRPACPAVGRASTRVRGRGAGQGDQFRLGFAIEDTPTRGVRRMMTRQSPVHAFFNRCWRVRATVSTLVSSAVAIWLSLHPSPASEVSAFSRIRAFSNFRAGCFPLLIIAFN